MLIKKDKVYDALKWVAIILLPAFAKLIENSFNLWDIPYGSQIASQIIYIQVFLGAILCVSNIQYKSKINSSEGKNENE